MIFFVLASCLPIGNAECKKPRKPKRVITVRLTVYWSDGSGSDYWTRKFQSSTGDKLRPGFCAVDPKIIPYGTKIYIPTINITLIAKDTGSDVVKKRASRGLYPIVDVYFPKKEDALHFANNNPLIVKAEIF